MTRKKTKTAADDAPDFDWAFAFSRHVVEHWDDYPDNFIAAPMTAPFVASLFTPERQRLIEVLRKEGSFSSVRALSDKLERDPTRVGRDLQPLINLGLVEAVRRGKEKVVRATGRPLILS